MVAAVVTLRNSNLGVQGGRGEERRGCGEEEKETNAIEWQVRVRV